MKTQIKNMKNLKNMKPLSPKKTKLVVGGGHVKGGTTPFF